MAEDLVIRPYREADEQDVIRLWHTCGLVVPWNDPARDIRLKIENDGDHLLVGAIGQRLVATVMFGFDGHRGSVNYLAIDPELQRGGLGRLMMNSAEERLRNLGCPKINLCVRTSNTEVIAFYHRIGYVNQEVVQLGKWLTEKQTEKTN